MTFQSYVQELADAHGVSRADLPSVLNMDRGQLSNSLRLKPRPHHGTIERIVLAFKCTDHQRVELYRLAGRTPRADTNALPLENEQWKPVPGFENYSVSNFGRVKRTLATGHNLRPSLLCQTVDRYGYKTATLSRDGKQHHFTVHSLVALAFIGPRPEGYQVNHINGVKDNNCLENLEYVTPSENKQHAYRIGITVAPRGERASRAKLTEGQVREIKRRCLNERTSALAREFGVTFMAITFIKRGVNWKHIQI